ncbi:MAG: hypothetical protein R8M46_05510 [Ghiorsea sp.]
MLYNLKSKLLFISIVTYLVSSTVSFAEIVMTSNDLTKSPRINNYVNNQKLLQLLFKVGEAQDNKFKLQQGCKSKRKVKPIGVIVTSPIDFPENLEHPKTGAWIYKFEYERCKVKNIYNAIFKVVNPGQPVSVGTYFSGSTLASRQLILDSANTVLPLAKSASGMKKCKDTRIQDMHILEQPHNVTEGSKTFKHLWKERWIFNICGKEVNSDITFYKDEARGGFSFFSDNIKLRTK